MLTKVNLARAFETISAPWVPKVACELNGQYLKVVKFEGEYPWHRHEGEDELFWVLSGQVQIELRDGSVELQPGEILVVPRGVEHRPIASQPAQVVLFEPASTRSTGDVDHERSLEASDLSRL